MFFDIITFGCKANQYDSSGITELMKRQGHCPALSREQADLVIINSCTVTENADRKVKTVITKLKSENPETRIILCGCFPKAFPDKARETGADEVIEGKFAAHLPVSVQSERTRAFLKIQDGCNRSCAYCIIPKARGGSVSRSLTDITEEAERLAKYHREIVITGINLCLYEPSLVEAVEAVCGVSGIERVRLGSLEPDMITKPDIVRLAKLPKLAPHFHLSLQSGSDAVLSRMNRQYTTSDYSDIAGAIHEHFPRNALTTDIIVGFPGETEEEFVHTLDFAGKMRFAKIHVFAFSAREGTPAAAMPTQIPKAVKRERVSELCRVAERLRSEFFESLIGTEQEVLTEKPNFGHTKCYTPVKTLREYKRHDIVRVRITGAEKDYCTGV
jgi:threonylcarbamoyladenosine tRNA methylthiotransferase MtaB